MTDTDRALTVETIDPGFLRGKRVLFFAPAFFGISSQVRSALERLGAKVDYYDCRPDNSFITKVMIRLNQHTLQRKINRYYAKIASTTATEGYDYVFVIKGEGTPASFLDELRRRHPSTPMMLYHWDSVKMYQRHFDEIKGYFDRNISFDPYDCEELGMDFLPLYFDKPYEGIAPLSAVGPTWDVMFVGTVHSDRYPFIAKVKRQLVDMGRSTRFHLFLPHKLIYWKKYFGGSVRGGIGDTISFTPMAQRELLDIYGRSMAVLDVPRPDQKGLTMRTLETLGARRKLITTNTEIARYDFYNPANICIVDRLKPEIPEDFLARPFAEIPAEVYAKYGIDNWLANIFRN